MNAPKDGVLAVLDEAADWLHRSSESRGDDARAQAVRDARAAVAEMMAANDEYDEAVNAHKDLIRRIAEQGWYEIEVDALRNAGLRTTLAQTRRAASRERLGGAA